MLRVIAERTSQSVRKDDVVARIGGDELLVLLTGVHSLDEATAIAEKIRARAEEPVRVDGLDLVASLSIGVTMSQEGESTDDLVARADTAMYEAKEQGPQPRRLDVIAGRTLGRVPPASARTAPLRG